MRPRVNITNFTQLLTNGLLTANPQLAKSFARWHWSAGMGFQDKNLWWASRKPRIAPHEGIDLADYFDQKGVLCNLKPGLAVPALLPGKIVHIHSDFLAFSLYIRHDQFMDSGKVLYTIFAHIQPAAPQLSDQVQAGETVALLARYPASTAPLHLHFTAAWIVKEIPLQQLNWQLMAEHDLVTLVDPGSAFSLLEWR